jgi:hypothetical protein
MTPLLSITGELLIYSKDVCFSKRKMEKTRGEMRKAEKRRFGVLFKNGFGM